MTPVSRISWTPRLLHGGSLELREQPYESYFRHVIVLPRPLKAGERHAYALRLRIPPGQPMAQHYVHVPFRRSDSFDLRVRFSPRRPPRAVWALTGVPTAVIYQRSPASTPLVPDRFGEIHVTFSSLSVGLGYGVCWQYELPVRDDTARSTGSPVAPPRYRPVVARFLATLADVSAL